MDNLNQPPNPPAQQAQATVTTAVAGLDNAVKDTEIAVKTDVSQQVASVQKLSLWQKILGFFRYLFGEGHIILFLIAAGLVIAKFGNYFINFLTLKSKTELKVADAQDAVLKTQADAATQQADALVQQANQLPAQEGEVDVNWNQKKQP